MSSRLRPDEFFPQDLGVLATEDVEVLNSKVHRELEFEYREHGYPDPETEFRLEDLNDELDLRDVLDENTAARPSSEHFIDE